jgi:hypothetical protein
MAGISIVFGKWAWQVSLVLGAMLMLIFFFYYIPYQLMVSTEYMHYGDWENAAKELALGSGAFIVAGCFPGKNEKLVRIGSILYAAAIFSFGLDHFVYGKEAADYVPSWIPNHIFWIYFAGIPLIGSGLSIILKIWVRTIATLLGIMIFIWFLILHIPYTIASSLNDGGGEATSAFLALGYSGIAFVIAGGVGKKKT